MGTGLAHRLNVDEFITEMLNEYLTSFFLKASYDPNRCAVDSREMKFWFAGRYVKNRIIDKARYKLASRRSHGQPDWRLSDFAEDFLKDHSGPSLSDPLDSERSFERMVERLPELQKRVLSLMYQRGKTLTEISTSLDIPVGTIKSALARGLATLRENLDQFESHNP